MGSKARDLLLLYLLGLIVNGAVALLVRDPGYLDAAYYFNGGVALAEGRGFSAPYIWNYVGAPAALPAPSFTYWQPLPALLAALGIILFGRWMPAFGAAQVVFVLLGAALPLLSYTAAMQIGGRRHALLAGLLTVFGGYYVAYWSLPESFTPFALSGAGALLLAGAGRASRRWALWPLAGACAGLAHLSRADGVLVAGVMALSALLAWGQRPAPRLRVRLGWAALGAAGYLLVMAPWFARNLAAFGSVQAPGGLSTLWMVEYNDLFRYPSDLTPARFFAAGAAVVLRARWQALLGNLATFTGVHNMVFLLPLTFVGAWQRRRNTCLLPALLYAPLLFAAMTFAFALPGLRGGWLHSGAALVPAVMALAAVGLDRAIGWAAQRRGWRAREAWQVFASASVLLAAGVTLFVVLTRVVGTDNPRAVAWNQGGAVYRKIGATLDALGVPEDALVMSNNPPGFYLHAGRGGVPIPAGPETMLLRAADDYGVTFLVIDHNIPPELESFYSLGPASDRFVLLGTYGSSEAPIYLYRILPPAPSA